MVGIFRQAGRLAFAGSGAIAFLLLALAGCSEATSRVAQISVVSSRPDMVSGGDALVRIEVPNGVDLSQVSVTVNATDITGAFRPGRNGSGLLGLVSGLGLGENRLIVQVAGGKSAELTLTNHPSAGPVLSGPHQQPFICETEAFRLVTGESLGAPLDENCSVARRVDYGYRTESGELKPLPDLETYPADLARTTTSTGVEVPYIIRIETGSANRGVYEIAMLHDPIAEPEPDPWTSPAGWNGRVIYTLGGGCPGGWFRQGARTAGVTQDVTLRQGYALVSSTLNVFGNNCSELLAAETAMMTKERFIEGYGLPLFTIGTGCSGGSYTSYSTADNFPGIFDGVIAGCSYPDVQFATTPWNSDARLLLQYFEGKAAMPWTEAQQLSVTGFVNLDIMHRVGAPNGHARRIRVGEACPDVLPESMRYHPVTNPTGARCEIFEHNVNVYGRDPETGFVRRPIDNVGVQYGLGALNDGVITMAQFLDLNERVGGYDPDGNVVAERTVADPIAMRRAYETGRLTNGGGGLAYTPAIDFRGYVDMRSGGDDHPRFFSFSMKERLLKANGHLDNFVMLTVDGDRYGLFSMQDPVLQEAFEQMDRWLTALVADTSADAAIDRVRRARPADLVDACWTPRVGDVPPTKIVEEQQGSDVPSRCQELYPSGSMARGVAGSSIASDIIKCQLRPIDPSEYAVAPTAEEVAQLQRIFPDGVCDWSRPGIEQRGLIGTWLVLPSLAASN